MDRRMYPSGRDPRAGGKHVEVLGAEDGYVVARGEVTLDGSNPTTAKTGLKTIKSASAQLKGTAAPGLDPVLVTVDYAASGEDLDLYAWKHTSSANPTLIASTNATAVVAWIAVGTL